MSIQIGSTSTPPIQLKATEKKAVATSSPTTSTASNAGQGITDKSAVASYANDRAQQQGANGGGSEAGHTHGKGRHKDWLPPGLRKNAERGHLPPQQNPFFELASQLQAQNSQQANNSENTPPAQQPEEQAPANQPASQQSQIAELIQDIVAKLQAIIGGDTAEAAPAETPPVTPQSTIAVGEPLPGAIPEEVAPVEAKADIDASDAVAKDSVEATISAILDTAQALIAAEVKEDAPIVDVEVASDVSVETKPVVVAEAPKATDVSPTVPSEEPVSEQPAA